MGYGERRGRSFGATAILSSRAIQDLSSAIAAKDEALATKIMQSLGTLMGHSLKILCYLGWMAGAGRDPTTAAKSDDPTRVPPELPSDEDLYPELVGATPEEVPGYWDTLKRHHQAYLRGEPKGQPNYDPSKRSKDDRLQ